MALDEAPSHALKHHLAFRMRHPIPINPMVLECAVETRRVRQLAWMRRLEMARHLPEALLDSQERTRSAVILIVAKDLVFYFAEPLQPTL